ncbi:uncharacterized protein LOC107052602 [Gallus gallus]|uniref:uncharacterized protein LOC107052602 n=1 Tax=Gallus gallus TaxID=9031 RepID=UPI001AEAF8DA|nr:uncharacterized protein LOC107052602 [Gallus gallus]XP_040521827.1 uncharacterized protein LOC107052602 [Gallus gallus]XP_040521828.1 uncharacterized protein LOC107052602 [Gallus gallus]XP_040521829.1 uncharacterized protein LOC107052602 [Gallus gallus]XP_040551493.1 uncharacterized protein LOC107052602 [Gallus gallus]XP_040551494.1 uncharacterized protein LOC107052602 [Gallus gallus]XP_040551495.1 uncharacterized protein LOC107052602 [Gallus gallus]XP_040551496.1 uncharacterized protein 
MGSGADEGERRRLRRPAAALPGGSRRWLIRGGGPAARRYAGEGCGSYEARRGRAAQGRPRLSPIAGGGAAALLLRPRAAAGPSPRARARTHAAAPQPPRPQQQQQQQQPPRAASAKRFRFRRAVTPPRRAGGGSGAVLAPRACGSACASTARGAEGARRGRARCSQASPNRTAGARGCTERGSMAVCCDHTLQRKKKVSFQLASTSP